MVNSWDSRGQQPWEAFNHQSKIKQINKEDFQKKEWRKKSNLASSVSMSLKHEDFMVYSSLM